MNSVTFFWQSIAWQWPHIAMTIARALSDGILIFLTIIVTKQLMRKQLERLLPAEFEELKRRIIEAKKEAAHYKTLYESAEETIGNQRAIIKSSIASASHTVTNLSGTPSKERK